MANLFTALVRPRAASPDAQGDDSGSGVGGRPPEGGAAVPASQGPFNRRVRLVVEVLDDPDELDLAKGVFTAQGWGVRSAEDRDKVTPDEAYAGLIVEVPLRCSGWTAKSTASELVTSLAARRKIDLWVREAKLTRPKAPGANTTYHVHRKVPTDARPLRRWFAEHWIAVGGADVHHSLHLRGPYSDEQKEQVLAELDRRNLGGIPFDRGTHDVRLAIGPRPRDRSADRRRLAYGLAGGAVALAFSVACGITLAVLTTPWRFLCLIPPAVACWPLGRWLTSNEPRPWLVRLGVGLVSVGGLTLGSYQWAVSQPDGLPEQLIGIGWVLLGAFTAFGLWYALSHSWFSRNMHWFLPVLAAPLPFVLPWMGAFLHAVYLEDVFGIPADTVHVAFYWQYMVALKPLAITVGFTLVFVALAGWARHFNWQTGISGFVRWILPLLAVAFALTVALDTLHNVEKAGTRTMEDTAVGRRPAAYFGLQGELVCVKPLTSNIPVLNGPVPTERPVLTFQASGDVIWVWDPDRSRGMESSRHAVRLRAEDVTLVSVSGKNCPAGRQPNEVAS